MHLKKIQESRLPVKGVVKLTGTQIRKKRYLITGCCRILDIQVVVWPAMGLFCELRMLQEAISLVN